LITVPLMSKYIGFLAALLAKFDLRVAGMLKATIVRLAEVLRLPSSDLLNPSMRPIESSGNMTVFVSGILQYIKALSAMRAHASQLVWFRWLYVTFSRYMWVNEWVELETAP